MDDVCVPAAKDLPPRIVWPQRDQFMQWLDAIRDVRGLGSDNQLAGWLGVGHTLISGWRNGRQKPSIDKLNQIAEVTGEDPRRLWVLAGLADARQIGLIGDDVTPTPPEPQLPRFLLELLAIYRDTRLDERDRELLGHQISGVVNGWTTALDDRVTRKSQGNRRS